MSATSMNMQVNYKLKISREQYDMYFNSPALYLPR